MTDLEKARSELLEIVSQVSQGSWTIVLLAGVERVLAAARREGAEEMRERAAAVCDEYMTSVGCALAIRALPLTPEKPE